MAIWNYEALDSFGQEVKGQIEAQGFDDLKRQLSVRGMTLLGMQEQGRRITFDPRQIQVKGVQKRPGASDLAAFAKQLSVMQTAGVDLAFALGSLAPSTRNEMLREAIYDLRRRIQEGEPLSEAMAENPQVFNQLFVALVESGQEVGNLDIVLQSVSRMLTRDAQLQRKMRSAMLFPSFTLLIAVGISYYLLTGIVPQFASTLTGLGGQLPLLTRAVMAVSSFLQHFGLFVIGAVVIGFYALRRYQQTPDGRYVLDRLRLRTYLIGPLTRNMVVTRVSRSMSMLQRGGVNPDQALRISRGIADNAVYEEALADLERQVVDGIPLDEALEEHPSLFPMQMRALVASGNRTGQTPEMLEYAADFFDDEAQELANNLADAIEPLMIVVVGLVVGTIVVAMFLPYFAIMQTLTLQK